MRRLGQLYDDVLEPTGMRSTQYTLLAHIKRLAKPAVSELAAELVIDRSAMAHTLRTLERSGLISVAADPNDRRTKRATLTPEGEARLDQAEALWRLGQDRFEAAVGREDAANLRAMMDRLASADFAEAFRKAD